MISFKNVTEENKDALTSVLSAGLSPDGAEYLSEIIHSLDTDGDIEYAVSQAHGCALIRVFDMGRYIFIFPCELEEDADASAAIRDVCEYAVREEVPMVFSDVPCMALSYFAGYRHMDIDAEDEACDAYRVRIKTECELISEIPEEVGERVKLDALREDDIPLYAELCRDVELNKYWGYDYREDIACPSDEYFYKNSELEFLRGTAVSFAVRACDDFIGEATLYAFDGRGAAEFAIRILPAWQGHGLGTEAVLVLEKIARKMGLISIGSKVLRENAASVAMLQRLTDDVSERDGGLYFRIEI